VHLSASTVTSEENRNKKSGHKKLAQRKNYLPGFELYKKFLKEVKTALTGLKFSRNRKRWKKSTNKIVVQYVRMLTRHIKR
jgi:hypothetical protein